MMTSVTLPSSSGPIHGGFSSGVANEPAESEHDFETPRPVKRSLAATSATATAAVAAAAAVDSCKKRRKQATPVRISAADSPPEGKPPIPSPEPEPLASCPIRQQLAYGTPADQLEAHLATEHMNMVVACKQEPPDEMAGQYASTSSDRPESPQPPPSASSAVANSDPSLATKHELSSWLPELPSKDWINPNLLSFAGAANQMFMGLPSPFPQPDAMPPRQPIRIFNPDAYCELCNKEFCNKYFLKTHKANKHGIYTDPPATSSSSDPNTSSSSNPMGSVSIPSFVGNVKMPQTSALPMNVDLGAVKLEAKSYPEMFVNPFANKLFNKVAKQPSLPPSNVLFESNENQENSSMTTTASNGMLHNESAPDEQTVDESSSPRVNQNETTSTSLKQEYISDYQQSQQQELYYASPSKLSPGQQNRELDLSVRYRRIGVMNPKAFCEICCKEYCNKYFLRTHKMKRHGIYIPDDRDKDIKTEPMGLQYPQTSPLNLIMGEQSNSSSDRKTSSPSDISCESCGIRFQNMSLYQLHNVSVHAKLPAAPNEHHQQPQLQQPNNLSTTTEEKKSDNEKSSTDTISEDLQKLQTMILQLNDLEANKTNSTCSSCNKEFENRYYLHAHMMTEHGILLDENADAEKPTDPTDSTNTNNNTMCDMCGKDFPNSDDLKKHIFEAHKPQVKDEFNNGFTTPEKSTIRTPVTNVQTSERRTSMNLTPTSSYCEICNKELCNKYFMKTHMQRMHGIEIENGAQIGGVVCDICNKELCSKYFLRVHKHNTHGIVEYGSNLLQPRKFEDTSQNPLPPPVESDPALKPADLADLSHRYFTHFTEVCSLCSRRFRSTKWLKAHLLSDHGQAGAEKWAELEQQLQLSMVQPNKSVSAATPSTKSTSRERISPSIKVPISAAEAINMQQQQKLGLQNVLSSIFGAEDSMAKTYHCSYCPFSTPVLPFLFVHERSHTWQSTDSGTSETTLKCPVCMQTFSQPDQLQHHIFSQHPFLPLPPFFNGYGGNEDISKEPSESADEADDGTSTSDQLKPSPSQPQPSGSGTSTPSLQVASAAKASKKVASSSKRKSKCGRDALPLDVEETLKEVARKSQLPATYALPQMAGGSDQLSPTPNDTDVDPQPPPPPYTMQAFLVEEQPSAGAGAPGATNSEVKFMPSIVFLPVGQKLSAPITATFTLTPA